MRFAAQWSALFRFLNFQKWSEHGVLCTFWLGNVLRTTTACTFSTSQLPKVVRTCSVVLCAFWLGHVLRATMPCTFSTSQLPKVVREWCALHILTWKRASRHIGVHFFDIWTPNKAQNPQFLTLLTWTCASRHNDVHFFDVSTSTSGPGMVCFVHFNLETCFASQWSALFRFLNFQKWSEHGVLCTFWFGNVLRTTTACTFSTSQLPKVVRTCSVVLCAFWLGHGLRATTACNFSCLIWPHGSVNRDFPTFSCTCIFFLRSLSLLSSSHCFSSSLWLFPPLLFNLSILSEVWLLNFLQYDITTEPPHRLIFLHTYIYILYWGLCHKHMDI